MTFQPFYEGLKYGLEQKYRDVSIPNRVILTNGGTFDSSSSIIDVLKWECLNSDGYARQDWTPEASGLDQVEQLVKFPSQTLNFSIPADKIPVQFDTAVLLLGGKARANLEIQSISGNPSAFACAIASDAVAGDRVFFTGGMPASLTAEQFYYLGNIDTISNSFTVSDSSLGSPIQVGESWTGILRMHYANGTIDCFQPRGESKIIAPGQTHSVPVVIGMKVVS